MTVDNVVGFRLALAGGDVVAAHCLWQRHATEASLICDFQWVAFDNKKTHKMWGFFNGFTFLLHRSMFGGLFVQQKDIA